MNPVPPVRGTVARGLDEGRGYVEQYARSLRKRLGFDAYPGTLNVRVRRLPKGFFDRPMLVQPPRKGLHPVRCVRVGINYTVTGAAVLPGKTRHPKHVLELVAPVNLREALGLKDGDEVVCVRLE